MPTLKITSPTQKASQEIHELLQTLPNRLQLLIIQAMQTAKKQAGDNKEQQAKGMAAALREEVDNYLFAGQQIKLVTAKWKGYKSVPMEQVPEGYVSAFIREEPGVTHPQALAVFHDEIVEPYKYPILLLVTGDDKEESQYEAGRLIAMLAHCTAPQEGDSRIQALPDAPGFKVALVAEKEKKTGEWRAQTEDGSRLWAHLIEGTETGEGGASND